MGNYRYKLTLEVEDGGLRKFEVESSFASYCDMKDILSYDIAVALKSTMDDEAPKALELAGAMEGNKKSIAAGLAYAYERMDANCNFDDCVRVIVDLDKLCQDKDDLIEKVLVSNGIEIKREQ